MEVKKHGNKVENTTQKKASLTQEEYRIPYRLVFFCVIISTLFLCFFHLHPYTQSFFLLKNLYP